MIVPGIQEAWLLPVIPLGAFVIIALLHNFLPRKGDVIGILAILASWILFFFVLRDALIDYPAKIPGVNGYEWIRAGNFGIDVGFYVDQVTLVMLFVVTTVALMVNIYSMAYMHGEARYGWFFAVLALFAFSMLMLVLADNLLLVYAAWELVGVCSFFLIGFYWERRSAAEAAKKAFVTTRIGDVGMLVGIILLWRATGTFNIQEIIEAAEAGEIGKTYLTVASLFLLLGPIGKSAQVPLHVWLPDAMEGPTPVSALIHAATMVVAGIYLVARVLPIFEAATGVTTLILTIGMITAIFAAIVALAQTDLKKVIAYSTLSNLGIMMVALGLGSVTAAMFHLMTHAFFKACLFLGAGSVIHSTGTQEMGEMGGLRKFMPITFITFFIAALANAGVIPLAGFFSKDEILLALDKHANPAWFIVTLFWVALSGMYTARMLYYTFFGQYRGGGDAHGAHPAAMAVAPAGLQHAAVAAGSRGLHGAGDMPAGDVVHGTTIVATGGHDTHGAVGGDSHAATPAHDGGHGGTPHESPFAMTFPLIVLGVLSIVAGFVILPGVAEGIGLPDGFGALVFNLHEGPEEYHFSAGLATAGTVGVLLGILIAGFIVTDAARVRRFTASMPEFYNLVKNKFYFDDMYQWLIDRVILVLAFGIAWFDRHLINDVGVDGTSSLTSYLGFRMKFAQTGRIPNYALAIVVGILILAVVAFSTRT